MDMELVLFDKAKMEFYTNMVKSYSSDVELWAYEFLPYFMDLGVYELCAS